MKVEVTINVTPDISHDRIIGSGSVTVSAEYVGPSAVEELARRASEVVIKGLEQRTR